MPSTNLTNLALALSASQAGDVTAANTPAQFDASKLLATMEALRVAGRQFSQVDMINGSTTITAAQAGRFIYGTLTGGGNYTWTLPLASSVPNGACITIKQATTTANMTVAAAGTDSLFGNTAAITSFIIKGPGTVTLTAIGGGWIMQDGTAMLPFDGDFAATLAGSGSQTLPSGIILKWGLASFTVAGNAITFGTPFPSAMYALVLGPAANPGGTIYTNSQSRTGFTAFISTGGTTTSHYWLAIGS